MQNLKFLKGVEILTKEQQRSINGGAVGGGCDGPLVCLPFACICGPEGTNLAKNCCPGYFCRKADNDPNTGVCLSA